MYICKLKINNGTHRHNTILALIDSGYKISVEEQLAEDALSPYGVKDHIVIVEETKSK